DQYSVRLRVLPEDRDRPEKIENLWIPSTRLGQVQLSNFAKLDKNIGPTTIERQARQRQGTLVANLADGVGFGGGISGLQEEAKRHRDESRLFHGVHRPCENLRRSSKGLHHGFLVFGHFHVHGFGCTI